jgi:4-alpha-glucanotransferase
MRFPRAGGILLHPTSLPGRYGIGDIGPEAYRFIDFLKEAGQSIWQVLPLGPTGYGDSPYQSFSTFAGNPLFLSPDLLVEQGHLSPADVENAPDFPAELVDYGPVIEYKTHLLRIAFESFRRKRNGAERDELAAFCESKRTWLDDYALFMACKEQHEGTAWTTWDKRIAAREPEAIGAWTAALTDDIERHKYLQYQFHRQWAALKRHAAEHAIRIIGDIPIFVAHDSADVWANPELFYLDENGNPTVVAGVPPDYFSETGQLWGNPLYRWDRVAEAGYGWWIERFRSIFELVDIVRLDHFRGFEGYWEVPATEETAVKGRWVKGPGADLFAAVGRALGQLPIIAEDLGVITPEVVQLRDQFEFPGMRILQFGFASDADDPFLPHNYIRNCVVYTGTHDNDTSIGWLHTATEKERVAVLAYFGTDGQDISWDFIRWLFASVADTAIVPLQEVLSLGPEARMNYPSTLGGNWSWRFLPDALSPEIRERLRKITELYGRCKPLPEWEPAHAMETTT